MESPNRTEAPLISALSDALYRIESNYVREGSVRPGGRFEGRTLQAVQAEYLISEIARREDADGVLLSLIRVRRLHQPDPTGEWCDHCWGGPERTVHTRGTAAAEAAWPCATIRALTPSGLVADQPSNFDTSTKEA